jgi:ribokinase
VRLDAVEGKPGSRRYIGVRFEAMKHIVVLGSLNIDLVVAVDRMPRPGETLNGGDLALFEGGKGANQACAVGRLGGRVTMIGQTGADVFGTRLSGALRAAGVDTSGIGTADRPTGSASIYVQPDGENTIVISPGANAALTPEVARERLRAAAPYELLLAQLESPMASIVAAFEEAKRAGAVTILDPAPVRPLPAELIPLIDFLTPNQSEAAALLHASWTIGNFEDARAAAESLLGAGYRAVVLKLGELGCYIASSETRAAVKGFKVRAVDTTGAGDTFNGAFAVALAEGASLEEAGRFANAAAAISVTRPGAQNSVPARAEVEALLAGRASA